MSQDVVCGLMGSGKTQYVVGSVIAPAVASGRRVVCNVEGIDEARVKAYCVDVLKADPDGLGSIVVVDDERITAEAFFPFDWRVSIDFEVPDWVPRDELNFYGYSRTVKLNKPFDSVVFQLMMPELLELKKRGQDIGSALVEAAYAEWKTFKAQYLSTRPRGESWCTLPKRGESVVQPGDLVALDEAWRFWGSDKVISLEHQSFVRMHRHYVHPDTGVTCDIVAIIQDIGGLNSFIKGVVRNTYRTHKAAGVGLAFFDRRYTVTKWEGTKLTQKLKVQDWTKKFDPRVFELYKSNDVKGAVKAKEVATDANGKLLNRGTRIKLAILVVGVFFCAWRAYVWWTGHITPPASPSAPSAAAAAAAAPAKPASAPPLPERLAGSVEFNGVTSYVVVTEKGFRLVNAETERGYGLRKTIISEGRAFAITVPPAGGAEK